MGRHVVQIQHVIKLRSCVEETQSYRGNVIDIHQHKLKQSRTASWKRQAGLRMQGEFRNGEVGANTFQKEQLKQGSKEGE